VGSVGSQQRCSRTVRRRQYTTIHDPCRAPFASPLLPHGKPRSRPIRPNGTEDGDRVGSGNLVAELRLACEKLWLPGSDESQQQSGRTIWPTMEAMSQTQDPLPRVLVAEDELPIRELLRVHLSRNGFEVEETGDGRDALERIRQSVFNLIVLDIMLPSLDGLTLCRTIRNDGANRATPILIVTARDTESDKVLGLESGADDYLVKPFGVREFLARVGAVLRRSRPIDQEEEKSDHGVLESRGVALDPARRTAVIRGEPVELTKQEFDMLYLLVSRPGIVFSRAALLARVWHGDTFVTERTVDTVVSRVRRKIEHDPQDPELILTAWGAGYKFVDVD
jgi:DNA-binding response OmpR family regulator